MQEKIREPVQDGRPVRIKFVTFPEPIQGRVKGITNRQPDKYLVLIDDSRAQDAQAHTLGHELAHIFLGHLDDAGGPEWRPMGGGICYQQNPEKEAEADAHAAMFYERYISNQLPGQAEPLPGRE